jgi:Ku protein
MPSGDDIRAAGRSATSKASRRVVASRRFPEDEIIRGYEHAKGHHVLIKLEELDTLKLEAKHTIDMARFVDRQEIDSRYFEKPYYLLPDGDGADEGYTVLRDALANTKKVAIGQLVMGGRQHLVGVTAQGQGLALFILRYADELRDAEPYFDNLTVEPSSDAVGLAVDLIQQEAGKFEPQKMPNEYASAVHELVQAKIPTASARGRDRATARRADECPQHHGCSKEEHAGKGTGKSSRCRPQANGQGYAKARRPALAALWRREPETGPLTDELHRVQTAAH